MTTTGGFWSIPLWYAGGNYTYTSYSSSSNSSYSQWPSSSPDQPRQSMVALSERIKERLDGNG